MLEVALRQLITSPAPCRIWHQARLLVEQRFEVDAVLGPLKRN